MSPVESEVKARAGMYAYNLVTLEPDHLWGAILFMVDKDNSYINIGNAMLTYSDGVLSICYAMDEVLKLSDDRFFMFGNIFATFFMNASGDIQTLYITNKIKSIHGYYYSHEMNRPMTLKIVFPPTQTSWEMIQKK